MKKHNKKYSVILFTLLLLCTIETISYQDSASMYIKEEVALRYNVGFKQMTSNIVEQGRTNESTSKEVHYFFSFYQGNNMLDTDTLDTYEIIAPNCTPSINIGGTSGTVQGNKVSFTAYEHALITVNLTCPVNSITNSTKNTLDIYMYVNEYFNNDSSVNYQYTVGSASIDIEDYKIPEPVLEDKYSDDYKIYTMPKDRENKYDGFVAWLTKFAENTQELNLTEITNYYKSIFKSTEINEGNIMDLNNLDGLSVKQNEFGDYEFTLDSTFVSRVKTFNYKIEYKYYFYPDNYDTDALFLSYIGKYVYPVDSIEYQAVVDYLTVHEQENETVLDLAKRLKIGLKYYESDRYMTISPYLYENVIGVIPNFPYSKELEAIDRLDFIKEDLENTALSDSLIRQITQITDKTTKIYNLLISPEKDKLYDSYIYLTDDVDKILVHISSVDTTNINLDIIHLDTLKPLILDYHKLDDINDYIMSDLEDLSQKLYQEQLQLLDTDADIINNYNTLEDGVYELNIGTLTIETTDKKNLTIQLKVGDEPTEEEPVEEPTEEPVEAPAEEPTEAPAEEPTEAPAEEPTEEPVEAPAESTPEEDENTSEKIIA